MNRRIDRIVVLLDMIWAALSQRARCELDPQLSRLDRWFYTFKLIVCLLIDRELDYDNVATSDIVDNAVCVCITESGVQGSSPSSPAVHWFYYLGVGVGILHNWHYIQDSGAS